MDEHESPADAPGSIKDGPAVDADGPGADMDESGDGAAGAEPAPGPGAPASGLSRRDVAVLGIAARTWTGPGPRERAVRERLGMSPAGYFQHLNALLDDPRALAHDPVTVNRLRAARARHRDSR